MRTIPAAARGFIGCAALAAVLCAAPALRLGADAPWADALALTVLYALCERLRPGWAGPVLLAAALLLPPPLAALTALPGALTAPAEAPVAARRIWHAAELALACCAAGRLAGLLTAALGHHPPRAP